MPLMKCPDCKKMISDRADICPFCGCPREYFENDLSDDGKKKYPDEEEIEEEYDEKYGEGNIEKGTTFSLCGYSYTYGPTIEIYAPILGMFMKDATIARLKLLQAYDKAKSAEAVVNNNHIAKISDRLYFEEVDKAVKILYNLDIIITDSDFLEKVKKNYHIDNLDGYYKFLELYKKILNIKDQMNMELEYDKETRSRWTGGGFGLKGAIKGAMTAGVLNAGSSMLHGIGDGFTKAGNSAKISEALNDLYNNKEIRNDIGYALYIAIYAVARMVKIELEEHNIINFNNDLNELEARKLYKSTLKNETDKNKFIRNTIQAIFWNPVDIEFYETSIIRNALEQDKENLTAFIKFWNIEYLFSQDIINDALVPPKSDAIYYEVVKKDKVEGLLELTKKALYFTPYTVGTSDEIPLIDIKQIDANIGSISVLRKGKLLYIIYDTKKSEYWTRYIKNAQRGIYELENVEFKKDYIDEKITKEELQAILDELEQKRTFKSETVILWGKNKDTSLLDYISVLTPSKIICIENSTHKIRIFDMDKVHEPISSQLLGTLVFGYGNHEILFSVTVAGKQKPKEYIEKIRELLQQKLVTFSDEKKLIGISENIIVEEAIPENKLISSVEITCQACGKKIKDGANFCVFCGNSLSINKEKAFPEKTECPGCGKSIQPGMNFCVFCGTKLRID